MKNHESKLRKKTHTFIQISTLPKMPLVCISKNTLTRPNSVPSVCKSACAVFLYAHGRVFASTEKLQIGVAHDLWGRLSRARVDRIQTLITVHFIKNIEPFPSFGGELLFLKSQISRKPTFTDTFIFLPCFRMEFQTCPHFVCHPGAPEWGL